MSNIKKIVVVEDDVIFSKTIAICLKKLGYDVRTFSKGIDAVKYLFENELDLILLDIRLPDCDGWFIARLMDRCDKLRNVPVIIMSVLEEDHMKLNEIKPYAYIHKPLDIGRLLQIIRHGLDKSRLFLSIAEQRTS